MSDHRHQGGGLPQCSAGVEGIHDLPSLLNDVLSSKYSGRDSSFGSAFPLSADGPRPTRPGPFVSPTLSGQVTSPHSPLSPKQSSRISKDKMLSETISLVWKRALEKLESVFVDAVDSESINIQAMLLAHVRSIIYKSSLAQEKEFLLRGSVHSQVLQKPCWTSLPKTMAQESRQNSSTNSKFKTELCRAWSQNKVCQFGERCIFAHGEQDLRLPQSPGYDTEPCWDFLNTGYCHYGSNCRFKHHIPVTPAFSQSLSLAPPFMGFSDSVLDTRGTTDMAMDIERRLLILGRSSFPGFIPNVLPAMSEERKVGGRIDQHPVTSPNIGLVGTSSLAFSKVEAARFDSSNNLRASQGAALCERNLARSTFSTQVSEQQGCLHEDYSDWKNKQLQDYLFAHHGLTPSTRQPPELDLNQY